MRDLVLVHHLLFIAMELMELMKSCVKTDIYIEIDINSQYSTRQSIKEEEHPVLQGQVTAYI